MQHSKLWLLTLLVMLGLLQSGCAPASAAPSKPEKPATTEVVEGSDFKRVTLTQRAAERIQVATAKVRTEQLDGKARLVVPYASLIYGLHGETWVYTSPKALTFMRASITVDYIEGDNAVLVEGPEVGTEVATVGVAELYGADTGVGK